MVLLHHRLAFPPSRWKQVRSRLGAGRPHTVVLSDRAWPSRSVGDHRKTRHHGFRDHLRWDVAADTLVLTGSREAFELEADQVRALAEECPAHRARAPETHCCAEIGMGVNRCPPHQRRPYATLHAEYSSTT
ncbi:hypothetical protein [Micromonospora sp. WMMD714]|uniref:hypothetical protein n=1 Tax=Micromonospora sp. WMMD714 TaxID=3016097 RepID=UPI00249A951F|nr:hypothetical protein [Micromonospora sp. WMMD714]WFE65066.1 hypothetical protein O7625_18095 [Micromonospora sp. WMMD714]